MSDRAVSLQSISITSRNGVSKTERGVPETATVHLSESFGLSANIQNSSDQLMKVVVEAKITDTSGTWFPGGGTKTLRKTPAELKPGDEFTPSWPLTAPSEAAEATITVTARILGRTKFQRESAQAAAEESAQTHLTMAIGVNAIMPATCTDLTPSLDEPVYGQPLDFFVTVGSKESSVTPDGNVQLLEGKVVLGGGVLSNGAVTITLPAAGQTYLSPGQHNIVAEYLGNGSTLFEGSTSPQVAPYISPAPTGMTLTSSPIKHAHVGDSVTFTATVTAQLPPNGIPVGAPITGSVAFTDEQNNSLGPASSSSAGVWTLTTSFNATAQHTIKATHSSSPAGAFAEPSKSIPFSVLPLQVKIAGRVLTAAGQAPISGVTVSAQDKSFQTQTAKTQNGYYSFLVNPGEPVTLLFPNSCTGPNGQALFLKPPGSIYLGQASAGATLPDVLYELRTCQVTGTILQQAGSGQQPLSGVQVTLVDSSQSSTFYGDTSDAQGNFCFNPTVPTGGVIFILQLPPTLLSGKDPLVLSPNALGGSMAQQSIRVMPDAPVSLPPVIYTPQLATLWGRVTDSANNPLVGINVELSGHGRQTTTGSNSTGVFTFSNLQPGKVELRFPSPTTDANAAEWELPPGEHATQSLTISAGQVVQATTVTYQTETHSIEQQVLMDGSPAEDVLVDVRLQGASFASQSKRTGRDGRVIFLLAAGGTYEVRVYPDPSASGGPQVNVVNCSSSTMCPPVNIPRPGGSGGSGGGGRLSQNADKAAIDLQAYPVLTQDFSPAGLPSAAGPAGLGTIGGTSPLGQTADRAIREVLSWRTKSDDPKGFMGALNQAFALKEIEGHTEFTWTPRSYTVQTDMGAVTGAQASIYTRAKVALDQSMPLLDGLYALIPYVEPEDLATVQAVVRTQFSALVNEFGVVGGPRVPRVDELFELLLGPGTPTNPEDIKKSGSLGLVRQRFGLERRFVTTVDDEQNLTNYLILVDYVIGLKQSWNHDKAFFIRTYMGDTERRPFFGTQLVLMSRALEVVAQGVQDAYYTMDSVFMNDPERQTSQLDFADLEIMIPDKQGGQQHQYTFPHDTSGLFVAELLDWVYRAASDELPGLLQDAGKDGLESFTASTDRLRKFVHGAIAPGQNARGLPPGYHTPRVRRAIQLLADGLDEAYRLAFEIRPPEFPVELTPEELRRIRQALGL